MPAPQELDVGSQHIVAWLAFTVQADARGPVLHSLEDIQLAE